MIKVLNVNVTIDPINGGGTAERTIQLTRALTKRGIECSLLTLDIGITEELKQELKAVSILALACFYKRFYLSQLPIKKISQLVKNADIVHIMGHWTLLNLVVFILARYHKKPYVICPAGALIIFGRSRILKKIYNFIFCKSILKNAAKCIAITQDELTYFEKYQVQADKITIIPNAVVPENYQVKEEKNIYGDYNSFILFLGRLNSIKGPDLLLQAFHEIADSFPQHYLLFAGPDDGLLNDLKTFVKNTQRQDRVHFLGHVAKEQKAKILKAADFLVIPSRSEAMSIVVFEAGCTATPVLITDQCGMNDLESKQAGKVVPASVEGIKQGLIQMLNNPDQTKKLGRNLQDYTLENFTWDIIAEKYLQLFKDCKMKVTSPLPV